MKIYLEDLNRSFCIRTQHAEIAWYWCRLIRQQIRLLSNQLGLLQEIDHWKAIHTKYGEVLRKHEAYELLSFIREKQKDCLNREVQIVVSNNILGDCRSDTKNKLLLKALFRKYDNPN